MAIEARRGCGYRKVGGMYLMGAPGGFSCDRLPIMLTVCPCCSAGIKPTRGWTWIFPHNLFQGDHVPCFCEEWCPVCRPMKMGRKAGLLWVGEQFYSPKEFAREAGALGVSRRLSALPRGLVLGRTWVLMAHRKAALHPTPNGLFKTKPGPGIFYAFKPTRIDKIITETQAKDENEMLKLERRGITPVVVPDDDKDHR